MSSIPLHSKSVLLGPEPEKHARFLSHSLSEDGSVLLDPMPPAHLMSYTPIEMVLPITLATQMPEFEDKTGIQGRKKLVSLMLHLES